VSLQKDIVDLFYEIVVAIVGEKILRINGHQPGDEGNEGHFCVFMQRVFLKSVKNGSTSMLEDPQ
jgi:hypothetical protein